MHEINARLLTLRKKIDINQTEFGYKLGVSRSVIQNLEGNKTTPSNELIDLICHIYSVNKDWLISGTGNMLLDTKTAEIQRISSQYNLSEIEGKILRNYLGMNETDRKTFTQLLINLTNEAPDSKIIPFTSDIPETRQIAADTGIMPQASHSAMNIREVGYDDNQEKIKADIDALK